jgi:23S rRNA (adenine2030-N6)-methyltransferase
VDAFFAEIVALQPPSALAAELAIAGDEAPIKMKGCGLMIINPPWQFAGTAEAVLAFLAGPLAQAPGGSARVTWPMPEK